jgi:hypothetical protein
MAVCWRCPHCSEISCEDDVNSAGHPLACDHCERPSTPDSTQCTVCDAPNPWARRDSVHYWCLQCGNTQTFYSNLRLA